MAAYAAVLSLVQTLHPDNLPPRNRNPKIEELYDEARSLQSSLESMLPIQKKTGPNDDLDNQIREAIYRAQDKMEAFIFRKSNPSPEEDEQSLTSALVQDLQPLITEIAPLVNEAEKKKDPEAQDPSSSDEIRQTPKERITIANIKPVGQEKDLKKIKEEVLSQKSELQVVPIIGLPGIGKTTLAQSLYNEAEVEKEFALRAWVTVSQDYQVGEVFSKLYFSMETHNQKAGDNKIQGKEDLRDIVYRTLYEKKYLIVVDDIWDTIAWDKIKLSFPDKKNGSRIVLTSRYRTVAEYARFDSPNSVHEMEPLDADFSWILLTQKAFEDGTCPPRLKDIGWEISLNCRGLPLSLTVIGGLLHQEKKTEEYWEGIQKDITAACAQAEGDNPYMEILALSYNHLPRRLKGCFLYMGAFPEDSEIPANKLVNLWVAEGFLRPPATAPVKVVEHVASEYLEQLIDRNLLHVRKITSSRQTKACGMHDSLRELAMTECATEKFFHSRKRYTQDVTDITKTQRRLSVHRNILMCMEEVHNSVKQIDQARTIIYAGSHHHHPMPFCLTFDLLRVLDAFTVYFIEFPNEIVKLIHLRYLSFTYNGKLPPELSNLQKLQILIARRHPKIIFLGTSFMPDGIWNMPQLRHLLFTESGLPMIPAHNSPLFNNLQTLSSVSAVSCTEEVIKSMPNLKKLGMWTEKPGPVGLYLSHLQQLESFKFVVLNPNPKSQVEFQPELYFPETLKKLRLSGCSLPWKHMEIIAKLPALEVLKLREVAFKGEVWSPKPNEFVELKFLMLEYLDLKKWEAEHFHFPKLQTLILRHCYELEAVPRKIANIGCLKLIEMVDCSPDSVETIELIVDDLETFGRSDQVKVKVYSSWE